MSFCALTLLETKLGISMGIAIPLMTYDLTVWDLEDNMFFLIEQFIIIYTCKWALFSIPILDYQLE